MTRWHVSLLFNGTEDELEALSALAWEAMEQYDSEPSLSSHVADPSCEYEDDE